MKAITKRLKSKIELLISNYQQAKNQLKDSNLKVKNLTNFTKFDSLMG